MDLTRYNKQELKNLLENANRLGRNDVVTQVLQELTGRGMARGEDYRALEWNQEAVRQALKPFHEIAASVPNNKRTAYTEAGGMKIGRSRQDPDWKWIDSYCAIKRAGVNAVFVCYVDKPGDDPRFKLIVDNADRAEFGDEELDHALGLWRTIAKTAAG